MCEFPIHSYVHLDLQHGHIEEENLNLFNTIICGGGLLRSLYKIFLHHSSQYRYCDAVYENKYINIKNVNIFCK